MLKALSIIYTIIMTDTITTFKQYTNNTFKLSPFQEKACNAILDTLHVLVTAHTGSGKTLPAEFAIYYYVHILKKRVIYTSPIKALSNQKYKEFKEKFPTMEVGILTGDIKHNPEADILIMTTEILQNHCFKQKNRGLYLDFKMDLNEELGCVVFDEVHYIDDMDRGTIWEQTMMMLPNSIPYVMLSATIGQKERFANWVETMTNKKVVICHHNERVVPLHFYEYFTCPEKYVGNIKDKPKKQRFQTKLSTNMKTIKTPTQYNYNHLKDTKYCHQDFQKDRYRVPTKYVLNECLKECRDKDMFPSLLFVFSRKQVEHLASQITVPLYLEGEKDSYVEPYVRQTIVQTFPNWREYICLPEYQTYIELLEKGIGIHHAGMLPVFREIMEILYEKKYIKCLIATETFAIGLNMPTRTVLFSSLYKHDGTQLRLLQSHEFTQMAGRAGRRNLDVIGHVILLTNLYDPLTENEYKILFDSKPKVLNSKFRLTYHLLLNYLHEYSEDDFIKMIKTSMMNRDICSQIKHSECVINTLTSQYNEIKKTLDAFPYDIASFFENYDLIIQKMKCAKNKERKKLGRELRSIEEKDSQKIKQRDLYNEMICYKEQINKEKKTQLHAENYIHQQIQGMYHLLQSHLFIDEENKPTIMGLNACYLHEIPCLAFCDMYKKYNKFNEYNEEQMICLLSCFYDLKVKDDFKEFQPCILKDELTFLKERVETYIHEESQYQLYITNQYSLQYDLMSYMKQWYNEIDSTEKGNAFFNVLKQEKDIFIGDFMKACMKIINMCNELIIFCENDNNYKLLEKIQKIQTKIQKSIVTNQSFYL